MTDRLGLVPLPEGTIACAPGGRTVAGLPEDSPALEAIESFRDFLRIAPPSASSNDTSESYLTYLVRTGHLADYMAWRFMVDNDPGLRQYIAGGAWT